MHVALQTVYSSVVIITLITVIALMAKYSVVDGGSLVFSSPSCALCPLMSHIVSDSTKQTLEDVNGRVRDDPWCAGTCVHSSTLVYRPSIHLTGNENEEEKMCVHNLRSK
jgi:hypothetical protein